MKVKATQSQIEAGCMGGCIGCGHITEDGVEPDARGYECENCDKKKVCGLEELLMMGKIELVAEED